MSIDKEIEKLTIDLNEEFETHFVEVTSSYAPNENMLTIVIDYPLARGVRFFIYRIPRSTKKSAFNEIRTEVIKDTNKYIRNVAKTYDKEYK